ncbi:MAG: Clp protease ClpP [Desulfotomaculum sp.]|nr:Clp protease ClpP [Desulfotomaculum sp.]
MNLSQKPALTRKEEVTRVGNKFWRFKNVSEDEAELYLYGVISESSWWDDEVTPKRFIEDLKALGDIKKLKVRINSRGGDVFAGQAIHSILKTHKAEIIVYIDGLAASIASVIAMAGDTVIMPRNAMMMVHNPWTIGVGNANEFRELADVLDKIRESLIAAYEEKSGLDREKIIQLLDEETWLTAEEAVEYGLADQVDTETQVAASIKGPDILFINGMEFNLSKFKKRPIIESKAGVTAGFNNMVTQKRAQLAQSRQPAANKEDEKMEIKTVEELKQHFPDLVAQVENAAREEGAKNERQRIKAIDEISKTISPALVAKAKYEEPMTAEQLAFEALKADAAKGSQYLAALNEDKKESGVDGVTANPHVLGGKEEERQKTAQALAEFINQRRKK